MDINNVLIIGYSYCRHIRDAAARPSTSKFCTSAAGRVQTRHVTVPIQPRLRYSTQQKSMLLLRRVLLKPPAQFRKALWACELLVSCAPRDTRTTRTDGSGLAPAWMLLLDSHYLEMSLACVRILHLDVPILECHHSCWSRSWPWLCETGPVVLAIHGAARA